MAVQSVTRTWAGESSQWQKETGGQSGTAQHTEVYDVVVDNTPSVDSSETVIHSPHPDIPKTGDTADGNPFLLIDQVQCNRESPIQFKLTAHYKARTLGGDNPLNEPPKIRWVTVKTEGEIDEDVDGNALVNANGEPLRGIRRSFSDLALEVSQNFSTFSPLTVYGLIDRVSNTAFAGFPAGTPYLDDVSADLVINDTYAYWVVSATILFRKPVRTTTDKAWHARIRHQGLKVRENGQIVKATVNGELESQPVMLDVNGEKLPDGAPALWLEFPVLEETDLNVMGFSV